MASQLVARHWIDGEWVDSQQRAQSINPANGETIGTYTEAGEAEAKRAIAARAQSLPRDGLAPKPPPQSQGNQRDGGPLRGSHR
jgi:betaine-aldehyde dehydrogenase